jgi:isopenicillin-N epimerase
VEPLIVSWGWKYDRATAHQRDEFGSTPSIRSHEFQGVRDPAPWLATPAAIDYHQSLGAAEILARDRELAAYARRSLATLPGMEAALPDDQELCAAMVSYRLPDGVAGDLQRRLWQLYRIEAPVLSRPDGSYLRVSTHFYNTPDEIDQLRAALAQLLA